MFEKWNTGNKRSRVDLAGQQYVHVNSVYVAVRVLVLWGGSSLQQASLWPRRVYRLWSKGLRREDYPERESSSLGYRRAQMAHSEARGLQQDLVRRITGMWARCWGRLGRRGPWLLTLNPNGGNLTAPQGNGLQMHPFPPSCWCASISSIWCMNEAEQERQCDEKVGEEKGWCGGGEAGNLCVSFEACLMAFLCQVPLQGLSGNLALEGIRTLTIRGWVQASSLESLCISQTALNITCDIQTLLYAEAVTREQDRTTWRYKRQSMAKEKKKKKPFLFLRTVWTSNLSQAQVQGKISARNGMERLSMRWSLHNSLNFTDA